VYYLIDIPAQREAKALNNLAPPSFTSSSLDVKRPSTASWEKKTQILNYIFVFLTIISFMNGK
jgi:hypothetical protein